ncbi:M24 family metallopeptidase [Maridesulfovibrio bastinii]|uniref:M24 family metallopeptidase n=1 Tax=Maridesulfovibrio bastinii TaxID=47157 RepID=UPI00040FD89F|nr:M24 family metallopeptidase [Maridesulfovibrio bastinii]
MTEFKKQFAVPEDELKIRWEKCRDFLRTLVPDASGVMAFSRLQIYYLSGSLVNGVFWLPLEGEPVLFVRRSLDRAMLESPVKNIRAFKSYSHLAPIAKECGSPLTEIIGVESGGLTWQLGEMLTSRIKEVKFKPADKVFSFARSLKSEFELEIMRRTGELHHHALFNVLPGRIKTGMTEREISHIIWNVFFELGHQGLMRMQSYGEEIFLGHVSAGDSGIYPSSFNGPLGLRGEHPSTPCMGNASVTWKKGTPLSTDVGFVLEGYHTDKTQIYWGGNRESIPESVLSAQSFCEDMQSLAASMLKPGATPEAIYLAVLSEAEKRGFSEGFMGIGQSKVPFLGHGIGLAVDGFPPVAKGFDLEIQKGMVFAFEPKQSIPGVGMVGVENTFEVTADGCRSITGDDFSIIYID